MTSSRNSILAAVRRNQPPSVARPSLDQAWIEYADVVEQFCESLAIVGGRATRVPTRKHIAARLEQVDAFRTANWVYSLVPDVTSGHDRPTVQDPHELEEVDFAVIRGRFGVAENAAIWITEKDLPVRVLPFICQHLAIILPVSTMVHNMHQAYAKLPRAETLRFGVFISGPSKTADIEQSLVIGAHGARSLDVYLVENE